MRHSSIIRLQLGVAIRVGAARVRTLSTLQTQIQGTVLNEMLAQYKEQ